jgi:uncharacterized membrane protein (UPF0127 family)
VLLVCVAMALIAASHLHPAASEAPPAATALSLDGAPIRPELALTSSARSRGLMFRRQAPPDGMLFVFERATTTGFWMKNTLVPLTISFFDTRGRRVGRLLMQPCRRDPCPSHRPGKAYRFALELPSSDRRSSTRLGPVSTLARLIGLAN